MSNMRAGVVDQALLAEAIAEAAKRLDPRDVSDVRFRLGEDHDGDPSIFFGILLSPRASGSSRIGKATGRISTALFEQLQPYNRWGLLPYFSYTADRDFFLSSGWM